MYIIDHFEERSEWVIIKASNCQTFKLPRLILPADIWPGDELILTLTVDRTKNEER